jgi:hypothetical protein
MALNGVRGHQSALALLREQPACLSVIEEANGGSELAIF